MSLDDVNPIPLSPSIFEQAGFVKKKSFGEYVFRYRTFSVLKSSFGMEEYFTIEHNIGEFYPRLEYVHQLQNLYYDLTGTELNLNICTPTNPQEQQ